MSLDIARRGIAGVLVAISLLTGAKMATAQEKAGHISIDGYRLNYLVEGSGDKRLLVIGSAAYYQRVFSKNLRDHLSIAFIDHRGFTEPPPDQTVNDVTLDKVISDIEAIRQKLGWEEVTVLGHSGHGFMALEYAKRHASHVTGVVIMNLGPSYSESQKAAADRDWDELVAPERKTVWVREMSHLGERIAANPSDRFLLFMLAMGARSWHDPHFDAADLWKDVPINLQAIDHLWGVEFRDIDITRGLGDFDKPVLLTLGHYDYLVPPPRNWDPVRDKFRDLTVRIFAESGHSPMLEEPEAFDRVLLEWLKEKVVN